MTQKEAIGKLTPAYFRNGESFDKKVFGDMTAALQKQQGLLWVQPVLFVALFGFGWLIKEAIGGAIGNGLFVVFIFLALILSSLAVAPTQKKIRTAQKALGITGKELNEALKKVKEENKA